MGTAARYPRVMWLYARNRSDDFAPPALQRLALGQGIILDWDDEARTGWGSDGATVAQSLRSINPEMRIIAYIRGSFWPDRATMSAETSPRREAVRQQMVAKGWWASAPNGQQIRPWPDQPLLSADGINWLGEYIASQYRRDYWDGVHIDGMLAEWWHLGAPREQSQAMMQAMVRLARRLRTADIDVQGNGAWAPSVEGVYTPSPYEGIIAGAFVEQFPTYTWYDGMGGRAPAADVAWPWHMQLAQRWVAAGATLYLLHTGALHEHSWFRRYVRSEAQATRLALASSCIAGCWFSPPMRNNPYFCDEMNVVGGGTSWDVTGRGWLGQPVSERREVNGLALREFENGLVAVNPTIIASSVTLPAGMYRRIRGWYDVRHNDGAAVDVLTLQPYDAALLWRQGEAPKPKPEPEPEPEPPEETIEDVVAGLLDTVETMLTEIDRTDRRLEALERAIQGLVDGWLAR